MFIGEHLANSFIFLFFFIRISSAIQPQQRHPRNVINIIDLLMEGGGGCSGSCGSECDEEEKNANGGKCLLHCLSSNRTISTSSTAISGGGELFPSFPQQIYKTCPKKDEKCIFLVAASTDPEHVWVHSAMGCESEFNPAEIKNIACSDEPQRNGNQWKFCCNFYNCNLRLPANLKDLIKDIYIGADKFKLAMEIRVDDHGALLFLVGHQSTVNSSQHLEMTHCPLLILRDYDDLMNFVSVLPGHQKVQNDFLMKSSDGRLYSFILDPLIEKFAKNRCQNVSEDSNKVGKEHSATKGGDVRGDLIKWVNSRPQVNELDECRECKNSCTKNLQQNDDLVECIHERCQNLQKFKLFKMPCV